jgi:uncharacterized protein (TIGR02265 family)
MSEPLIFSTVVDGARRAFGKRLTPELLARLREAGMDFEHPLPAYPMDTFLRALEVLASALAPGLPAEAQHRQLGREFMQGFVQTAVGFAALTMARVIGVKRTLGRFGRTLKTTGNYVEAEVRDLGPTEVELVLRVVPEFRPRVTPAWAAVTAYRRGVLEGTLELLGVEGSVELVDAVAGGVEVLYRVRWSAR